MWVTDVSQSKGFSSARGTYGRSGLATSAMGGELAFFSLSATEEAGMTDDSQQN